MKILSLTHARMIRDSRFPEIVDSITNVGFSAAQAESWLLSICSGGMHWRTELRDLQRDVAKGYANRGWMPPVEKFEEFYEALSFIAETEQKICQK